LGQEDRPKCLPCVLAFPPLLLRERKRGGIFEEKDDVDSGRVGVAVGLFEQNPEDRAPIGISTASSSAEERDRQYRPSG
jgi:hypothetical protein